MTETRSSQDLKGVEGETSSARTIAWRGGEVALGLMYEFIQPGEILLDVGVGSGSSSVLFRRAGMSVWGMDVSEHALDACRERGFAEALVQHDLQQQPWPFADGQFDHAVSLGVLNHFDSLDGVLAEFARVLGEKGRLCFTLEVQDADEAEAVSMRYTESAEQVQGDRRCRHYRHSDRYLRGLLADAGLVIRKQLRFVSDQTLEGDDVSCTAFVVERSKR
jgi:ubiquinone/menaquinone biosynthesis C-methylase UbiE